MQHFLLDRPKQYLQSCASCVHRSSFLLPSHMFPFLGVDHHNQVLLLHHFQINHQVLAQNICVLYQKLHNSLSGLFRYVIIDKKLQAHESLETHLHYASRVIHYTILANPFHCAYYGC